MIRNALNQLNHSWQPIAPLIIFLICFIVYVCWTYRSKNKQTYENYSYMPLEDGVKHERY